MDVGSEVESFAAPTTDGAQWLGDASIVDRPAQVGTQQAWSRQGDVSQPFIHRLATLHAASLSRTNIYKLRYSLQVAYGII